MQNIEIETKRKLFLKQLEKQIEQKKFWNFVKFSGPGLKRKIQKINFFPNIYIPYLFNKIWIFKKEIKTRLFWGREVSLNRKDPDGFFLGIFGFLPREAELKLTIFFIKNLKPNDIFYDIGANYGFYTYLALEFCKEVHSFEPLPDVFKYLKKNLNLKNKSNIFLNNVAVANKKGRTILFLTKSSGLSTIEETSLNTRFYKYDRKIEVPTIALDEYISDKSKPTVIKMDVEGAESLVIDGARNFLVNNNPTISMEVWPKDSGGEISMKAVEKLRKLGYKSYFINQAGELEIAEGDLSKQVKRPDHWRGICENFIFKK